MSVYVKQQPTMQTQAQQLTHPNQMQIGNAYPKKETNVHQPQRRLYGSEQYQTKSVSPRSQVENDIKFLKTFFSCPERQVDDSVIESVLAQCGNDREKAFDRLMLQFYKPSPSQVMSPAPTRSKRSRSDFENETMSSAQSTPARQTQQQSVVDVSPKSQQQQVDVLTDFKRQISSSLIEQLL